MNVVDISRWQFGITTVYHFIFVPLTIGLAPLIAVMQTLWVVTDNPAWYRLTKFFGKLFLINFAIGVATGIVQEFQFGMNWSEYSRFVGDVFGAPLAMEGLAAFFFESTFIGLWIFGEERQHIGHFDDTGEAVAVVLPADRQDREVWICLGIAQRFGRRHLHRLLLEHQLALVVAGEQQPGRGGQRNPTPQDGRGTIHGLGI